MRTRLFTRRGAPPGAHDVRTLHRRGPAPEPPRDVVGHQGAAPSRATQKDGYHRFINGLVRVASTTPHARRHDAQADPVRA
eukprot:CAMPEP_0206823066 /NCGR_PEP_ID=MMETSP0975-20121206/13135_1 /ASSEMBLY_ACC=CAM_ASM_000399 /TAXON_ID=483370 /ORGANISM="non described non described, Strain CCMP2097" /LENGTH=80 /DNA_ID=CAMNT_0054365315 /DNA_START=466 /DNA_END=705 /DNA_ORIENTATION=-